MASGSSGQNGIDILCDAAGSDLLLSSLYPVAAPEQYQQKHEAEHRAAAAAVADHDIQLHHHPQKPQQVLPQHPPPQGHSVSAATASAPKKQPSKRKFSESAPSAPASSHVCHICRRVYERADHLTRHLRSHENARLYQCSRCPKRFNRADLLTRHETTHDRDGAATGDAAAAKNRALVRRSDRAAEACLNCSASKSKCEDEKPCARCRNKGLPCQMPDRRTSRYRTSDVDETLSPSETSTLAPSASTTHNGPLDERHQNFTSAEDGLPVEEQNHLQSSAEVNSGFMHNTTANQPAMTHGFGNDIMFFNTPAQNPFHDMEFSWDLSFEGVNIPQLGVAELSPRLESSAGSNQSRRTPASRDHSRDHAAFQRSPWLWEPQVKDNTAHAKEDLALLDEGMSRPTTLSSLPSATLKRLQISSTTRDRLFAIVLGQQSHYHRVPSFPSLDLLNHLVQAHFVRTSHGCDSWIHALSFDPESTLPELLCAVIASGATCMSIPAIWKFGYAMQEVVRVALGGRFEGSNSTTRDLMTHQAYMLELDIGQWSGFSRKMEIAESFLQPLLTMIRRSGKMSPSIESASQVPAMSDSAEMLNEKWSSFVQRESYKRLAIHLFFHDTRSSIGLCKNPLMSLNDLCFNLPASRDLWTARSAEEWRALYLSKFPDGTSSGFPRVPELMDRTSTLDQLDQHVDTDLCRMAILHGFWGQVFSYREAVRFSNARGGTGHSAARNAWMSAQHQELYQDLCEFSTLIRTPRRYDPQLVLLCELIMMVLHVSPDELQRFAGKSGEEEARTVAQSMEKGWATKPESRYAVWHAGQVLRQARQLTPSSLRGFNAIAVYFASLALWANGLVSSPQANLAQVQGDGYPQPAPSHILVDGDEGRETRAFLELGSGVPSLRVDADPGAATEPLSNPDAVLSIAQTILRDNFSVRSEPPPPLVESLGHLLRDLGSGSAREASEEAPQP